MLKRRNQIEDKLRSIEKHLKKLPEGKLAAKKYLSALWNDLNHEMYAINLYLRRHSNYKSEVDQLLMDSPEVEKLLSPYFSPLSKELDE